MNDLFRTDKLLYLDGAMGTMLHRAGLRPGELPELLALTNPDLLTGIHRQYVEAGADVVYANTFGANRRKLRPLGVTVEEVVRAAMAAAKKACAGTSARVALDIGPLGELLEPLGTLDFSAAVDMFAELVEAGVQSGADLIAIETMTDLQEARAALIAAKERSELPVLVTMSFDENGRTFTGCTAASMAATLTGLGADAIGLNCSLGPKQLLPILRDICQRTPLPVIAKPNAGLPDPVDGHYDLSPEEFADAMAEAVAAGVSIVGGCCGTDPSYIRALHERVQDMKIGVREIPPRSLVCTATRAVEIDGVRVIGERINPTGKKRFQQALLSDDLDYIVDVAIQQEDAGADILDVNVGYPGVDEVTMLPRVVKKLQEATALPLQLDSSNPEAIEAALRVYCGKAAVNSVNGDKQVLERVLPIVKKYGACVVGLTLDEGGLPTTAQQRLDIAARILDAATAHGIPRQDLWIDCLTLTVSAQQEQAEATLEALRRVTQELGLRTVLGVSNISFGLPNRLLMAQTFLVRALSAGLTLPIINPNQKEMLDAIAAFRVLSGEDAGCRAYVARFADATAPTPAGASQAMTLEESILRGLKGDAARLAKAALTEQSGLALVECCLIPALDKVGAQYEAGRAFLPQLLSAAQAAQAVFAVIQDSLGAQEETIRRERVLIATVKGDIHDIGKNIVKTVMSNYGYDVLDLGRDVPPETIVEAAAREHIRLVGLSALMTTTLPAMEETVRQLRQLPQPPAIMLGGAVVTAEYAAQLGAFYARDAKAAVEIARRVLE
ncbi:MAG: homocysteine S-methyltransferase family protein [Clostridiales bacterium]|nr:homocysteine S-methyltransferase family protein [Clostridiales bacterium]